MKIPPFLKLLFRQVILCWDPKVHHEKIFHDQLNETMQFPSRLDILGRSIEPFEPFH